MSNNSEFKRVRRGDKSPLVKTLPNGAEIHKASGKEFHAYDAAGNYLGWTNRQPEAEYMAQNGYPNRVDEVGDLSLWGMWNDAIDSGNKPVEDADGVQYLWLPDRMVMSAKEDDRGFDIKLMTELDFWEMNRANHYDVLALKIAAAPLLLK